MSAGEGAAFSTGFISMCSRCGWRELKLKPRTRLQRVLSFQLFQCNRCGSYTRKFRFTWMTGVGVLVVVALIGLGVYLKQNTLLFTRDAEAQGSSDALVRARSAAGGQLSPFEQMMLHKPKAVLDNSTILKLVGAKVEVAVILQMIRTSTADYDLSAASVIQLKEAGVDQQIILAMIDASYNTR